MTLVGTRGVTPRLNWSVCAFLLLAVHLHFEFTTAASRALHEDHKHGGHEEEEDEEHEATLKSLMILYMTLILIAISIVFEYGKHFLEHKVSHMFLPLVEALFGELMVLGFIGILTFLANRTWGENNEYSLLKELSKQYFHEAEELPELFEEIHFVLFFVMCLFILFVVGFILFGMFDMTRWRGFEKTINEREKRTALVTGPGSSSMDNMFQEMCHALGNEKKLLETYSVVRQRFIAICGNTVDPDFNFAEYRVRCLGRVFAEIIELHAVNWLVAASVFAVTWAIDFSAKEDRWLSFLLVGYVLLFVTVVVHMKLRRIRRSLIPHVAVEKESTGSGSPGFNFTALNDRMPSASFLAADDSDPSLIPEYAYLELPAEGYDKFQMWLHGGVPNRHEMLFWCGRRGPAVLLNTIRTILLIVVVYLAVFIVYYGKLLWEAHPVLPFASGLPIVIVMYLMPVMAETFSLVTHIEQFKNKKLVRVIMSEQRSAKCVRHVGLLGMLASYVAKLNMFAQKGKETRPKDDTPARHPSVVEKSQDGLLRPRLSNVARSHSVVGSMNSNDLNLVDDITKLFSAFDKDKSGQLNYEEIKEIMNALGRRMSDDEAKAVISQMDQDGNGTVDKDEFVAAMVHQHQACSSRVNYAELVDDMFGIFDKDGSGVLSLDEVYQVFQALGQDWQLNDVMAFFKEIDINDDHELTKDEFKQFVDRIAKRESKLVQ
eukprot:GFYU01001969.1.p1 GENE.GFYU01001969.1~~GFYU01001969.1.p1  ORF type:complete len:715 (-),score=282.31 GFYU01001969.1:513-2657(-)